MSDWNFVSSNLVLITPLFDVTHDRAEHDSGAALDRKIVRNPPASVMLPRDENGRVLLLRQYRIPLQDKLWEAPAGRSDAGEEPLETARRELKEETGYTAARWTRLTEFHPAPGFATERLTAFLAEDLTAGEPAPEPHEVLERRWFDWAEALEMARDGRLRDAKTLVALLWCDRFVS